MVWLEFEPGVAEWLAQVNPLSYGGTPQAPKVNKVLLTHQIKPYVV